MNFICCISKNVYRFVENALWEWTCVWMIIERVGIGNWIYWTFTTNNYSANTDSHALEITTACTKSFQFFAGRSLVTAFNAVASSASTFMSLRSGDFLTTKFKTSAAYNTSARTAQKTPLPTPLLLLRRTDNKENTTICPLGPVRNVLPSNGCCLRNH
jgi:hypothetical protein